MYEIGPFTLDPHRRLLLCGTDPVPLAPKAMETLLVLVEKRERLVSKDELMKLLWPDSFVEESNLSQNIFLLRKALGDSAQERRYILTVPGRGYQFTGTVRELGEERKEEQQGQLAAIAAFSQESPLPATSEAKPAPENFPGQKGLHDPSVQSLGAASKAIAHTAEDSQPAIPTIQQKVFSTRLIVLLGIVAVAAIITIVLIRNRTADKGTSHAAIRSLAVLPLKNLSGDPAQEYMADGLTETLIARLSGIHHLRVISRTSVVRFKNTQLSAPEIARTLGVDALVEGSVIREGNRIRVHAQLIRGTTDEHFWSEAYDRELRDVLSLESDVAQSIARKVEVTVTGKERERLTAARSVSPEVYESYLKGRFAFDKSNNRGQAGKSGLEESIRYFEDTAKKDPAFAPAYIGLASAYRQLGAVLVGGPPAETRAKVISAARKALEIDPELAEAHARLADIYQEQFRWSDAEAEYQRALELKPNDAVTHRAFAVWLLCQGRTEEAIAWSRRARELDPLGSGLNLGFILFYARRYDEAVRELRSVLAIQPDNAGTLWFLGFALIAKGRPDEAIPVLEKAVSASDRSPAILGVLIRAYAQAGRRADALRLLAELKRRRKAGYVPPPAFVNAYLGLGEYDQAFAWLEQAYQEQSNSLQLLKVQPFFDPIRDDPRFKDLLRRVGLD